MGIFSFDDYVRTRAVRITNFRGGGGGGGEKKKREAAAADR